MLSNLNLHKDGCEIILTKLNINIDRGTSVIPGAHIHIYLGSHTTRHQILYNVNILNGYFMIIHVRKKTCFVPWNFNTMNLSLKTIFIHIHSLTNFIFFIVRE